MRQVSKDVFYSFYKIKKIRRLLFTFPKYRKLFFKLGKLIEGRMNSSDIWIKCFRVSTNIRDFDFSCPTHAMMMLHAKPVWPSLASVSRVAWNVNDAAAVTPRVKIEFSPWSARLGRYRSAGVCTILTISGRITFGVTLEGRREPSPPRFETSNPNDRSRSNGIDDGACYY